VQRSGLSGGVKIVRKVRILGEEAKREKGGYVEIWMQPIEPMHRSSMALGKKKTLDKRKEGHEHTLRNAGIHD